MSDGALLVHLENDHVAFDWRDDASGRLVDRPTGREWRMAPTAVQENGRIVEEICWHTTTRNSCTQYAGRFRGTREGEGVRFSLTGPGATERGTFRCTARLDGPWLEIAVEDVDESLPSLIFPPPLEAESFLVPNGIGRWVRSPQREPRFYVPYSYLTMPWFGGLRGDEGWLAVFAEGHADAGVHLYGMQAAAGWLKSMGRWQGRRAVRYRMTRGGYVGVAKAFREWAEGHGMVRSLREKLAERPRAEALVGGPIISIYQATPVRCSRYAARGLPAPDGLAANDGGVEVHVTHAQAAALVRAAREAGLERALVNVRGWINGGYDASHPDVWPPEPLLGEEGELRALLDQPAPYAAVLHDNYADMYEGYASFPRGIVRTSGGEWMTGGVWAGGHCFLICPEPGLAYARRNWEQMRTLAPHGMFPDTTTASQLRECYDAEHPTSRTDDERLKVELLRFYLDQGLIVGSENVASFGAPLVHWFENRHSRAPGEYVPLWPLVFHDCAVCTRYVDPLAPEQATGGAPNWLADVLWGYAPLWAVRRIEDPAAAAQRFVSLRHVYEWHARVALDEMVAHEYLAGDFMVERTEFSSGAAVVCNFAAEPRTAEGRTIPAHSYVILD